MAAVVAVVAVAQLWPHAGSPVVKVPPPQTVAAGQVLQTDFCHTPPSGAFEPTSITIPGITHDSAVIALPRDANDIPSPLPLTDTAKHEFAWDEQPSPMPGAEHGNVMMNTHTWPWFSTPAMGNLLLDGLHRGMRIMVFGAHTHLCYQVTRRVQIWADQSFPAYYDTTGSPQLAIMVCSGQRLGPGDWAKRTVWFASPMA
jgi:hypothetical protein